MLRPPFNFRRNEEVDKNMVIRRLQRRLAKLHLELANYKVHFKALKLDVTELVLCWVYKIVLLTSFWSLLFRYTKSTFDVQKAQSDWSLQNIEDKDLSDKDLPG